MILLLLFVLLCMLFTDTCVNSITREAFGGKTLDDALTEVLNQVVVRKADSEWTSTFGRSSRVRRRCVNYLAW